MKICCLPTACSYLLGFVENRLKKIEGNLVEDDYISFVSQFKIPYLYALTCGEQALVLNGEKMLVGQCKLQVLILFV